MKKRIWICCLIVMLILLGVIIYKNTKYYDLSKFTSIDLDNLYIRGRNKYYNEALNYVYGNKMKAATLSIGSTANDLVVFYDENGNEKFVLDFLGNQNQVRINNKRYLYKERNTINHVVKELYPDKNKSDCEKMLYDIVSLYEDDDYYMWDYYNEEEWYYYPPHYINAVRFINEGIKVDIFEYEDDTIENDYNKECNRIKTLYKGKLKDNSTFENNEINTYVGINKNIEYTVIKYDKFIISIEYSYNYGYKDSAEVNKNIEILNKYLKGLKIL